MTQWTQKRTRVQFGADDDAVAVDVGDAERAQLIAAAPDLLAALEDALNNLETLAAHGVPVSESGKRAMQSYRAAIAKATGR